MQEYHNVDPSLVRGTNQDEPPFGQTQDWLNRVQESHAWGSIPALLVLLVGEEWWVIDGNQRRDFAEDAGLSLPSVILLETDDDLKRVRNLLPIYSKIQRLDQLIPILQKRLK